MKKELFSKMQVLTSEELMQVEGGRTPLEYLAKGIGWVIAKIENAYEDFIEGWNSVNCGCNQ